MILFIILCISCIFITNCDFIQYKYIYTSKTNPNIKPKYIIPIFVDKNFSNQDKMNIDNAINQWNYVLNGQMILQVLSYEFDMQPNLIIEIQNRNGFLLLKVDRNTPNIPDSMSENKCKQITHCKYTLAWADKIGGNVIKVVRDRINEDDLQYLILHEIGHLLYLTHVNNKESLMYSSYTKYGYLCVDQDSASKVANNYGLDIKQMNYCLHKY